MNWIAGALPEADPMAWVTAGTIAVGLEFLLLAVRHALVGCLTVFARRTT